MALAKLANPCITAHTVVATSSEIGKKLLSIFKSHAKDVPLHIFKLMDTYAKDYMGGTWNLVTLSNGGAYMRLNSSTSFHMYFAGNDHQGYYSPDAASIVVSLYTLGALASKTEADWAIELYFALRDFALLHPEAENIFRAID